MVRTTARASGVFALVFLTGCTNFFSAVTSVTSPKSSSSLSSVRVAGASTPSPTKFGMMYFVWHCDASVQPVSLQAGQLGNFWSWHWWAKPDAGFYCPTRDRAIIRHHAELLRDAGIDFVVIDGSNFPNVNLQAEHLFVDPVKVVLEEWSQVPGAPKVTFWIPMTGGNTPDIIDRLISQYPSMLFQYQGKPLLTPVANPDVNFRIDLAQFALYANKYTLRPLWTGSGGPTEWSFLSPCQADFKASNGDGACNQRVALGPDGNVEQITATTAYQQSFMSDAATAVPKFGGKTFIAQMRQADRYPTAPIVLITGWNEWIAQRQCLRGGAPSGDCSGDVTSTIGGNPIFTDTWDGEYNRDLEPGGGYGDFYYRLLVSQISVRKNRRIDSLGRVLAAGSVTGYVDQAVGGGGQVTVTGWACGVGQAAPMEVHLYANGEAGSGGQFITRAAANLASEDAIAIECGDRTKSAHRFSIVIDGATARAHLGQGIWVHGIATNGTPNFALANSGAVKFPDPGQSASDAAAQAAADQAAAQQIAAQQAAAQAAAEASAQAAAQAAQAAAQVAARAAADAAAQAAALAAAQAAGVTPSQGPTLPTDVPPPTPAAPDTVLIHRFYQARTNEHFFTASYSEGINNGFAYEGAPFRVLTQPTAGAHPIFRCNTGGMHFISVANDCEGNTLEGTYGYLYDGPQAGATNIYRLFEKVTGDHVYSATPTEGQSHGYILEGGIGYAP